MRIPFAHLCDYASISREGKLSVLGIFDAIRVSQVPWNHPMMYLAFEIEAKNAELGATFSLKIDCADADGQSLFTAQTQAQIGGQRRPGKSPHVPQLLGIANLALKRAGDHSVNIWLNGHLEHQLPFEVLIVTPPAPPTPDPGLPPAAPAR